MVATYVAVVRTKNNPPVQASSRMALRSASRPSMTAFVSVPAMAMRGKFDNLQRMRPLTMARWRCYFVTDRWDAGRWLRCSFGPFFGVSRSNAGR
jgi:hypothetical protein